MSELLERGSGLLNDADSTLRHLGDKLNRALDGVTTTVGNTDELVIGLKQGRGPAGKLLEGRGIGC
jgi:phospholipid/cholesterol/gamma-HCH transport system substrate-binding protein